MNAQGNGTTALTARMASIIFALAAAVLAAYGGMLVYAAATFEGDSLPGPVVLYMVAAGVGIGALLCAGLAHVLWRWARRQG